MEDLRRLPYTDMVIKESMRLMPPVWSIGRVNREATEVLGYPFPEWSGVQISIYCAHRNPEIWQRADEFMPERWADESINEVPKYAYIPFGGGPRICIGNSFATMEANLLLATIAQRFRLRLIEGVEIVPQPFITMFPRDGLPMRLEAREPQAAQRAPADAEAALRIGALDFDLGLTRQHNATAICVTIRILGLLAFRLKGGQSP